MRISFLLLLVAFATVALAQTSMPEPKTAIVPRMDAQVKIDGVLDEQPWQKAARLTPFARNDATTPARVETEVLLWYDQAALYVGWICQDQDIQATFTQHECRQSQFFHRQEFYQEVNESKVAFYF